MVYGAGPFASDDEATLPPAMPDWSPVRSFKGYGAWVEQEGKPLQAVMQEQAGARACQVHGHQHAKSWASSAPVSDSKSFWGALGCACWAV